MSKGDLGPIKPVATDFYSNLDAYVNLFRHDHLLEGSISWLIGQGLKLKPGNLRNA